MRVNRRMLTALLGAGIAAVLVPTAWAATCQFRVPVYGVPAPATASSCVSGSSTVTGNQAWTVTVPADCTTVTITAVGGGGGGSAGASGGPGGKLVLVLKNASGNSLTFGVPRQGGYGGGQPGTGHTAGTRGWPAFLAIRNGFAPPGPLSIPWLPLVTGGEGGGAGGAGPSGGAPGNGGPGGADSAASYSGSPCGRYGCGGSVAVSTVANWGYANGNTSYRYAGYAVVNGVDVFDGGDRADFDSTGGVGGSGYPYGSGGGSGMPFIVTAEPPSIVTISSVSTTIGGGAPGGGIGQAGGPASVTISWGP